MHGRRTELGEIEGTAEWERLKSSFFSKEYQYAGEERYGGTLSIFERLNGKAISLS